MFDQFRNSIQSIINNPHINKIESVNKHFQWQIRKALNRFPYEQRISNSRILAKHKKCGVSALINSQGLYNFNNMNLIKLLLQEGGVFFDIGANIGSYSLIASEQAKATVFSFEPHPFTFNMLKENIELNHRKNVRLINMALGIQEGEVFLTDEEGSATNHIDPVNRDKTVSVKCRRGDLFCQENQVVPTLVKIDVEGFEYDVLAGFGDFLKKVDLFLIEINGLSDNRSKGGIVIQELLVKNGFKGPYYFHFDERKLSKVKNHEDPLFASHTFLKEVSFKVMGQV